MANFKKFKENCLPNKECFFNSLKNCSISDEEYQRLLMSGIFLILKI